MMITKKAIEVQVVAPTVRGIVGSFEASGLLFQFVAQPTRDAAGWCVAGHGANALSLPLPQERLANGS